MKNLTLNIEVGQKLTREQMRNIKGAATRESEGCDAGSHGLTYCCDSFGTCVDIYDTDGTADCTPWNENDGTCSGINSNPIYAQVTGIGTASYSGCECVPN